MNIHMHTHNYVLLITTEEKKNCPKKQRKENEQAGDLPPHSRENSTKYL